MKLNIQEILAIIITVIFSGYVIYAQGYDNGLHDGWWRGIDKQNMYK